MTRTPHPREPATRNALKRLELMVTRRLTGAVHGDIEGFFPGPGTETGDGRIYVPGDDVRLIDWNLTARTSEVHVRDPIHDHELDVWLVVDASPSQYFGTRIGEKRELAMFTAAAFGFAASRLANRVGGVLVFDGQTTVFPPRSGEAGLNALLHSIASSPRGSPAGRTDLAGPLASTAAYTVRRGFIAVISDFLLQPGWQAELHQLSQRHTVVAVEVVDPRELELVDIGSVLLEDPETGEQLCVDTSDSALRERYQQAAARRRRELAGSITRTGAEHLRVDTDADWIGQMVDFLRSRRLHQHGYRRAVWQT
ncbi:DUF58 domain-containing protein [Haloechinothrix sp. LS1_15]|uniref:DUF58 domain-containing protein n=1 Tax=Haloechinothrix sp. LS1_15 TaxID=2652248 RepID=UPI002946586F|nr:DUF58 domain-containing protein [Haloechinothrix sp. LS1_15]MDV6013619.1 DUF58 domain-containing protein [Haloechinothrix sp. LS1_15]